MTAIAPPTAVDYAAVEAALTAEQRAVLNRACRLLRIPREHWLAVGPLRGLFVALAVQARAERLNGEGLSWERAVRRAADELGVNAESHVRQVRRWRADADKVSGDTMPVARERRAAKTGEQRGSSPSRTARPSHPDRTL
jgi:hypothetical protein